MQTIVDRRGRAVFLALHDQRILVTGGGGFVGGHVLGVLRARGAARIDAPTSTEVDLRDARQVVELLAKTKPDIVIHLAALVGGIEANRLSPGTFFYDNAIMGIQLMEASRLAGVSKFVGVGTVCAYPKNAAVPFREEDLWTGYPEETNAPYGLAKKMLLVQGQAYRKQYGFNAIHLLMVNLYGPGDRFDLTASHVIPAMIRKFCDARAEGRKTVVLWGTGSPTREFLFVRDGAEAIVRATERYDEAEPVNIGGSSEIAIRDLAALIAKLVGYDGEIIWDPSRPDGQPRRKLDVRRAERCFGFRASIDLESGLRETIAWYRDRAARQTRRADRRGEEALRAEDASARPR